MIKEPEPIFELSETPQEVKDVPGDLSKVLKIESALPTLKKKKMISLFRETNMFSLGNTRICL